MSEETWRTQLAKLLLKGTNLVLKTYTGEPSKVLDEVSATVRHNGQEAQLPLQVVQGNGPSLLGRNWLNAIHLDWGHIKQVVSAINQLVQKYEDLI